MKDRKKALLNPLQIRVQEGRGCAESAMSRSCEKGWGKARRQPRGTRPTPLNVNTRILLLYTSAVVFPECVSATRLEKKSAHLR